MYTTPDPVYTISDPVDTIPDPVDTIPDLLRRLFLSTDTQTNTRVAPQLKIKLKSFHERNEERNFTSYVNSFPTGTAIVKLLGF